MRLCSIETVHGLVSHRQGIELTVGCVQCWSPVRRHRIRPQQREVDVARTVCAVLAQACGKSREHLIRIVGFDKGWELEQRLNTPDHFRRREGNGLYVVDLTL